MRSDLLRRLERHPRLTVAIVEFELAGAPHLLSTMDYGFEPAALSDTRLHHLKITEFNF